MQKDFSRKDLRVVPFYWRFQWFYTVVLKWKLWRQRGWSSLEKLKVMSL